MRIALAVALAVALAACEGGDKREAQSVVEAVMRFRRAEDAAKPAAVEALRATACTAPDVCRARDACLASADATAKALTLKREVERGIAALEDGGLAKDSPEAQAMPKKLDEAEALLKEGHGLLERCDEQIIALKRRYSF